MGEQKPNIPTTPGPWYITSFGEPVRVVEVTEDLVAYLATGEEWEYLVANSEQADVTWLGPVPMPGTFAPRELFDDLWYEVARLSPDPGTSAYDAVQNARAWDAHNPAPEVTR